MSAHELKPFLHWFRSNGGTIDESSIHITTFPASEGGRGAIALKDIPEGHTIFTIPRSMTLSTRTSSLPSQFGPELWGRMKLEEGWVGLILCMMWEVSRGPSSKWFEYLATLPTTFNTPMFWTANELAELEGTSVVEKLGRAEADQDYREKLLPAILTRPDLFPPEQTHAHYSLEAYHTMGSRILSRSFNVEQWNSGEGEEENAAANTSHGSAMDVGSPEHEKENSDKSDEEDSSDIAMVPMADMLNARYESENVKLFHSENELKMISTKFIKAGQQIWNTYGDLPNSELLRRYGHVDLLPLSDGSLGNPGDVAEIRADLVVSAVARRHPGLLSEERIDWWLEEGGDDFFTLDSDLELPQALASLVRLLLLSQDEWEKVREKGKLPKPKVDEEVLRVSKDVLEGRLRFYPTSVKEDMEILSNEISLNWKHAVIVRLAEKQILEGVLSKIESRLVVQISQAKGNETTKRKDKFEGADEGTSNAKKSRR